MTKKECLEATLKMWRWLEQNPLCHKRAYFITFGLRSPISACYLCEYVSGLQINGCSLVWCSNPDDKTGYDQLKECPLHDLWPRGCISVDSPYSRWFIIRDPEIKAANAKKIADAAERELEKLNEDTKTEGSNPVQSGMLPPSS